MSQVAGAAGAVATDDVVVGVDGSEASRRALRWAAREAADQGVSLRVVHAFPFESAVDGPDPRIEGTVEQLRETAAEACARFGERLVVSTELLDGRPAQALVAESRRCKMLVLGNRGLGGFVELLLGSTAVDVTAHAACPVAVIPDRDDATGREGPVVVGVDSSPDSDRALAVAFARADRRGAALVAMHVWQPPTAYGAFAAGALLRTDPDRVEQQAHAMLSGTLEPWRERHPDVEVRQKVVSGQVVSHLARAFEAEQAEVVVVGARGRTAMAGMVLGSVSQGVLHHTDGPVIVAR